MKIYLAKPHNGLSTGVYDVALIGRHAMMLKVYEGRDTWRAVTVPMYVSNGKGKRRILIKRATEGWS